MVENPDISRRSLLKGGGAAFTGLNMLRVAFPASALAQSGEEILPWLDQLPPPAPSDVTDNLQPWERLDSWITPADRFFNVNHTSNIGSNANHAISRYFPSPAGRNDKTARPTPRAENRPDHSYRRVFSFVGG
jgi:hypothetical protein